MQIITPRRAPNSSGSSNPSDSRRPSPPPSLKKEIETITVYKKLDANTIRAQQRTATFLSPQDPRFSLAFARQPAVIDSAVDIRNYNVVYKRI